MTEEIIIDGVNVKDCRYHRMNNQMAMCTACNSGKGSPYCEYEKDCYYKQLQRLKQENKDLKKQIESDKGLITVGGKQQYEYLQRIDELEQENKELKEYSQRMENQRENYYKEWKKYRSALEEIKEICKRAISLYVEKFSI